MRRRETESPDTAKKTLLPLLRKTQFLTPALLPFRTPGLPFRTFQLFFWNYRLLRPYLSRITPPFQIRFSVGIPTAVLSIGLRAGMPAGSQAFKHEK
jgi:hypothetical protein